MVVDGDARRRLDALEDDSVTMLRRVRALEARRTAPDRLGKLEADVRHLFAACIVLTAVVFVLLLVVAWALP